MRRQWVWARVSFLNPAANEMGLDLPGNWSIQEALGGEKGSNQGCSPHNRNFPSHY